jgi:hypothetical protein
MIMQYFKIEYPIGNSFSQHAIVMYYRGEFPHFVRFYSRGTEFRYSHEKVEYIPMEKIDITKEEWDAALQQQITKMLDR